MIVVIIIILQLMENITILLIKSSWLISWLVVYLIKSFKSNNTFVILIGDRYFNDWNNNNFLVGLFKSIIVIIITRIYLILLLIIR